MEAADAAAADFLRVTRQRRGAELRPRAERKAARVTPESAHYFEQGTGRGLYR
jgi:hypothetical protein